MKAHILTGSRQEIVSKFAEIEGEIREAIVFVDDPLEPVGPDDDIFAEMDTFSVSAGNVDYSREALYTRLESE